MSVYFPRTCTEVVPSHQDNPRERPKAKSLGEFGDSPAIVLLGAPGAGKTTTFKKEAETRGGCYVTARNMAAIKDRPEWHGKTLFIDGLDEMRAGVSDQRTPFDRIRRKLAKLGHPRFCLSCREADWFGANDRTHLEYVSSDSKVLVLRLDPLSGEGIRKILSDYQSIEDIEEFISAAQQKGIDKLLENPQTLEMLATTVAGGSWPETRTETFESACLKLLSEQNPEHQLAVPSNYCDTKLLDAAGRLCALLLLSGSAGCVVTADKADVDSISLPEVPSPSQEILNRTIRTKLFKVENGLAEPIHRHIAEFLAGRHLAGLIDNGLPVRRILALITGEEDGGLVSALRGLAAWLAAHSKMGRYALIERDPEGVVLYGDVKPFSVDEKRLILDCLAREAGRDPWSIANNNRELDSRWGDLATPDMADSFVKLLAKDRKTNAEESVACAVLTAMLHGTIPSGLKPVTMNLIKDGNGGIETRMLALKTYIKKSEGDQQVKLDLKSLLDLIYSGAISDPYDRLLGRLLFHLYPEEISPLDVCRYFRDPKSDTLSSWYQFFWSMGLVQKTENATQLAEVLGGFVALSNTQLPTSQSGLYSSYRMRCAVECLLAAFFERPENGNQVDLERLFSWLELSAKIRKGQGGRECSQAISQWFRKNPKKYKVIFRMAVDRNVSFWTIPHFLFYATPPKDFCAWCLDQALDEKDNDLSIEFFEEAIKHLESNQPSDGLSRKVLEDRIADRTVLLNYYKRRQVNKRRLSGEHTQHRKHTTEVQQGKQERWRNVIRHLEQEILRNRCPSDLLHKLASAYLGYFVDVVGETGQDRISNLVGNDYHLKALVLDALRKATERTDLPSASEVIGLAKGNQRHPLALPFVAGLEEYANGLRVGEPPLDEEGMRRALAIHFHDPSHLAGAQSWYKMVLAERPDMYAESLIQAFRLAVQNGAERCDGLHGLAYDSRYGSVAQIAVVQLLRGFPARCKFRQLEMLKRILIAALKHCARDQLLKIVRQKLALRSLNVGQRVYWLAAGILLSPESFTRPLENALTGRSYEQRVRHLATFFADEFNGSLQDEIARATFRAKEVLIRFIGGSYRPEAWRSEIKATKLVEALIVQVSSSASPKAFKVFERLLEDATLKPWHPRIRHAAQRLREVRREACFVHASPHTVQWTLDNSSPANVADLAALVADHLADLAEKIRHGKTSDWRQYWNTDSARHPKKPKHEGLCRDALLSDLLVRLAPFGINAEPEGQYGNDRRADIRICYAGLNVPIEIKNNYHKELWTALDHKLVGQYAQEPGANGHGIYLVFWFGPKWTKATPPQGVGPKTAQELEKSLCDTLSNAEARKVSVVVVDVSDPSVDSISR